MARNIFYIFKTIYKPVIALVCVILFFISYNTYLVDHSLDNLRLALTQTASAQTLEETQSLQTIIDYALISELTAYKMNSGNVADLTLTRNIVTKGKSEKQIKDMESALKEIIKRREKQRGIILTNIDRLAGKFRDLKNTLAKVLLFQKPKGTKLVDTSLLDKARTLEESWKIPEAIENYELFIASHSDYINIDNIRLRLAYCYEKSKNYFQAQKIYERITNLSGGTKEAQIAATSLVKIKDIQSLLLKKGELTAKIATLKNTAELQDAYYKLGTINTKLMDLSEAQQNYKKVVELNPEAELALKAKFNLGWAYKLENKIEESSNVFQTITQEAPKSELASNSKYQVADNLKIQNKYQDAVNLYKEVSGEYEDKDLAKKAQLQAGYTYLYDLNNPEAAKEEFAKISMPTPAVREIIQDIGKEHRLQGYALLGNGRHNEAMQEFEEALRLNPKDTLAYAGMSQAYKSMGKIEEAISTAEKGSQIGGDDEYIFAVLGELYTQSNRYYEAIKAYGQAIEIRGDYVEVLYNLGFLYNLTSQYGEAMAVLEKAVKILPSYAEAYNNLGVAYWNRGRAEDAIRAYNKALKLRPDYIDALYNLGLTYKSKGQFEEAKEIFLKIIRLSPGDVIAKKEFEELKGK